MDPLLKFACRRVIELENILLVAVPETVWPAEVEMVYLNEEVTHGEIDEDNQNELEAWYD